MDEIKFEVGQAVYDSFRYAGYIGTVTDVGDKYYTVVYDNASPSVVYRLNRKYIEMDAFPTLYPHPYELEVKEVKPQFQKDDLVLFRNNEGNVWNIAKHWGHMVGTTHLVQAFGEFETHAKFVIPFKSNEDKLWKH